MNRINPEQPTPQAIKILAAHDRIPELDGFRALAIWMVLVHHAFYAFPFREELWEDVPSLIHVIIKAGWLGVDLFFVLSGFLITGILLTSKPKPYYFRNFFCRRILRIVPLYFTVIIVMYFCYRGYENFFFLSSFFMANFAGFFQVNTPNAADIFWSLSVEEHFYLIWPVLIWLFSRKQILYLSLLIVCLTPVLRGICFSHGMDPEIEIYMYSWFRFDGLALGAFIATIISYPACTSKHIQWLAMAFFAILAIVTISGTPFGLMKTKTLLSTALRYTQVQMIFATAISAALSLRGKPVTAILRLKFARVSSDLSYCLYLIHLGVGEAYMWIAKNLDWNPVDVFGDWAAALLRAFIIIGVSFIFAALSKKFIEAPFLRLKRYFV